MNLHQKITNARTQQGLTQEQLANLCSVTVRTIQRIESGDSIPRSFTLKAIAAALNIPFQELNTSTSTPPQTSVESNDEDIENHSYFLRMLCLSCFSYLLIPYLHFLIPAYLLKQQKVSNKQVLNFARGLIQRQVYWVIATTLLFLMVLGYNFLQAAYLNNNYRISYLVIFFMLYATNAIVIIWSYKRITVVLTANKQHKTANYGITSG